MSASEARASPAARRGPSALRWRTHAVHAMVYAILVVGAAAFLLPLLVLVSSSLKTLEAIYQSPPSVLPASPAWDNYAQALTRTAPFPLYFRNSAIIAVASAVGEVASCSFVAYGFARFRFPLRDKLFVVLLATTMIPFFVRVIPLVITFRELDWINTFLPLIVPAFLGSPLYIFLVRQFYLTIPQELTDAARIDGASDLGIWWRIFLPLSRAPLAAVAIFGFQHAWNDFAAPLVYLTRSEVKTAALGLYALSAAGAGDTVPWHLIMAATTVMIAPMVALYFACQRFFVEGIAVTGSKG